MVKVQVKWGKQSYSVDLDPCQPVSTFKTQLQELTCVPPERQKLMAKAGNPWKGILSDSENLGRLEIREGLKITLMGSAETVAKPAEKIVFIEDMKQEELAQSGAVLPAGLINMENTCYLNSTLQCLRSVPELRSSLSSYESSGPSIHHDDARLTATLRSTFNSLDKSTEAFAPAAFIGSVRSHYPQFDQRGRRGEHMQQDAEEFYSAVMNSLSQTLKQPPPSSFNEGDDALYLSASGDQVTVKVLMVHRDEPSAPYYTVGLPDGKGERQTSLERLEKPGGSLHDLGGADNLIDALFGIELESELACNESTEETKVLLHDQQRKLVCNIQGGGGSVTQISEVKEGIKLGFFGEVEKRSDVLGRNAVWTKQQRIKRLPRYICVQFMRFFWKATPNSEDHSGVKCKIMRPVSFPNTLDVYDLCSEGLKKTLDIPRKLPNVLRATKAADEILDNKKKATPETGTQKDTTAGSSNAKDGSEDVEQKKQHATVMDVDDGEEAAELAAAIAMSMDDSKRPEDVTMPKFGAAGPGLPGTFKGNYDIFAVVTHKGREADGGHYMGWVRQKEDDWLVFDDDEVSQCKTEDIARLKGGGDWHQAYLVFYAWSSK